MSWNWEEKDWPNFRWDERKLAKAEALFGEGAGIVIGASKHLDETERQGLSIEIMSHEAVDTSAIEGERLDRDSVQSSIRRHLGMATDHRRSNPAEAGIAEMMVDLYQHLPGPLEEPVLMNWHRLLMNGRTDIKDVGRYRTHDDPMQIISGAIYEPKVHFEAPPSKQVGSEMARFMSWLEQSGPGGGTPLPPVTRAGIAHLWFESIHPFEDGNGRVGRAIIEKVLAQGLSAPIITGMSGTLLKYRKVYYQALEDGSHGLEITDWLLWFATKAVEAQKYTLAQVEFILNKSRLIDSLRGQLNPRQEKALLRLFAAGLDGFTGGLSAAKYMSITDTPPATATRDLNGLADMGALVRTGERKSTRYHLNIPMEPIPVIGLSDIQ
ncbi:Fic family protein [Asticcacaulis sp. 201]|uniref:Fic family protein n=1 Tax=Asticcacaulis sp. 201 TaxID=3028787 RepID=UPI002916C67D|nr:Fic family protein [Asticcacaulis sp. 201]MDV6333145.1 Fic family protein [Asticcacaulis sp. 201]